MSTTPVTDELEGVAHILAEAAQAVWDARSPWPWETETSLVQQATTDGLPASPVALQLYHRQRGLPDGPPACEACGHAPGVPQQLRLYADFSADRVQVRLYCPPCLQTVRALHVLGKQGC